MERHCIACAERPERTSKDSLLAALQRWSSLNRLHYPIQLNPRYGFAHLEYVWHHTRSERTVLPMEPPACVPGRLATSSALRTVTRMGETEGVD